MSGAITFAPVPNWLLRRADVSPGAKLAYARIAQWAGTRGITRATRHSTLASELGTSQTTAQRYVTELRRAGLVEIVDTIGRANTYRLAVPSPDPTRVPSPDPTRVPSPDLLPLNKDIKKERREIPPNPPTGGTLGEASQTAEPDPWGLSGVDSEPADDDGRTMAIAGPEPTTAPTMATDAHALATILGTDHCPGVSADDGGPQAIPSRLLGPSPADQLPDETAPQSAATTPRSGVRGSGAVDHGQGPPRPATNHKRPGTTGDLFASPAHPKPPSARAKARASRLALAAAYAAGIRDATSDPYAPPTAKWDLEALDGIVDTYAVDAIGLTIADPTELAQWLHETAATYRRAVEADDTHLRGGYAPKQCLRWLRGGGLARARPALATAGPWRSAIDIACEAIEAEEIETALYYTQSNAHDQTERNLTHA